VSDRVHVQQHAQQLRDVQLAERYENDRPKPEGPETKHDDDAASNAGTASSDSSKGSRAAVAREPGEFISSQYDEIVEWLGRYLKGKKDQAWIAQWKTLFGRVLPLHTFLRCGCQLSAVMLTAASAAHGHDAARAELATPMPLPKLDL
jgi:hypothetical protein